MDTTKIIKGVVNSGRYTVTAPIIKEDYGLYLQIEGVELPSTYQVDFSNSEHNGTSVTMIGNSDGVLIPNQFISTGKDVFAFLYRVGANYGRTVYKFRIPNKCRPDRTEEEPTPEEQSVIDQAISALNTAVAQTAQDVIDADASAQNASADAERAEEARTDAQNYATQAEQATDDAQTYANNASASATASAQSASQSAQIKADVEDLVDDAQGYADSASQSASQASASEQGCARAVLDAASAAAIARARADEASGYAQTASAKAQNASQSASTASQKATESAQSATNASQSAQTAEQAKTDAQTAKTQAESARDSAVSAKDDAESARDEAQNLVDGISGKVEQIDSNTERIESLEDDRYKPYAVDTASGVIASFTDGADNIPLKSLVVDINPVQDLSNGDPSPENICPITGWTGCNVKHWSKNWIENASDTYSLTSSQFAKYTPSASLKNTTSGTFSVSANVPSGQTLRLFGYDGRNNSPINTFVRQSDGRYSATSNSTTFKNTIEFRIYSQPYTGGSSVVTEISDATLVVNDTATAYKPYQGQTIPISWADEAGTVYGGKLDVLTGILTVYPYYASYNGETLTGRWISDRDVYVAGTTPTIGAQVVDMSGTGMEVQLEAHEIASLLGANNIWADTGDISCEYRADTKLYIEKLTEPDADMIADANITSGQYFMVGNTLYKATSNIANGASIIVGTNCIRKSLSEALNEINA